MRLQSRGVGPVPGLLRYKQVQIPSYLSYPLGGLGYAVDPKVMLTLTTYHDHYFLHMLMAQTETYSFSFPTLLNTTQEPSAYQEEVVRLGQFFKASVVNWMSGAFLGGGSKRVANLASYNKNLSQTREKQALYWVYSAWLLRGCCSLQPQNTLANIMDVLVL